MPIITPLTDLYDHVLPNIRGCEPALALVEIRNAINEFLRRSRAWRVETAPIGTMYAAVSGITQANPAVVSATAHGFATGDVVLLGQTSGMEAVQGHLWTITVLTANSFSLDGCNSAALPAFSGGQARASVPIYTPVSPIANTYVCDVIGLVSQEWQTEDVLSMFGLPPSGRDSTLASPADLDAMYAGWRTEISGTPRWVHMHDDTRVRFVPAPGEAKANALTLVVALELSEGAAGIDAALYRAHYRAWAHGALRSLYEMKEKPWSDERLAKHHEERFENAIYESAVRARKGKVKSVSMARAVSYGGL